MTQQLAGSVLRRVVATCILATCFSGFAWSMPSGHTMALHLLLAGAAFVASEWTILRIRIGHNLQGITFGTTGTMLCLVLLPIHAALALEAGVALLSMLISRRGAIKASYNIASSLLAIAISALLVETVASPGHVDSAEGLGVLTAGCLLAATSSEILFAYVMAAAQHQPFRMLARQGIRPRLTILVSNVSLGLVIVVLARYSPLTLLIIPVVGLLLIRVHRGNMRSDQENDVWRQLSESGRETDQLSEDDIIPVALARTAALLRCDRVEIVLRGHDEPGRAVTFSGGLRGLNEDPIRGFSPPLPVADGGLPTPVRTEESTTVEVGLHGPDAPIGLLRAIFDRPVPVLERELQVLATYARNLGVTISSVRLFQDALREAELKAWLAHHDMLTGLVNRAGLLELSDEIKVSVKASRELYAVLVLDMDHFKEVNDTLGHKSGDRLLQHVSAVLAKRVRRDDVAARLEGDRFAVLLRHLPDDEMVESIASDILRVVSEPVEHEDMRLSLECSVGYAVAPLDGDDMEDLLKRADTAAGLAKQTPGSARRWRSDRDDWSRDRLALSADLREALSDPDQIELYYQPQVDIRTGAVVSVEALARWNHPTRGRLLPGHFIPIAEQSGLARPFTLLVIEQAVREASEWRSMGLGDGGVSIAVNLSARNLLDRSLPDDLKTILARHGLPARQLVLEITETVMVSELEIVNLVLSELGRVGVQISVDDFGTGFSSLRFLQEIKVNEIKIDRSFVDKMLREPADAAIVNATIELGHSLGLRVVAEGVEHQAQLDALSRAGCDIAQGYLLSEPMTAEQLRSSLLPDNGVVVPMRAARRRLA